MSENYDVVIIGAGPVGLMLALCLSRLGNYRIKHVDNRPERTKVGRADGIQARTLDVLSNVGLKRPMMAYNPGRIYEVAFWNISGDGKGIQRTGTWKSYPEYIDTRYPFTTILHQGRIEKVFLDDLAESGITVERPWTISRFENDGKDPKYPVEVKLQHVDGNSESTVRTKYLFGADGAHSWVREQLNINMVYKDPTIHVWSVIDGVVKTDFPDMQIKCTVHSPSGSAMVIPHGNNVVRIYVQIFLKPGEDPRLLATESKIQETARNILSPYYVTWERVDWYSAYRIGQGVAEHYSLDQRVFIGGDACHTHSPKAGQGMNYGFLDAHNLAWKLHLVESSFLKRELLTSYEEERKPAADALIAFDAKYAGLFSARPPSTDDVENAVNSIVQDLDAQNSEFVSTFKQSTQFVSGYGVEYATSRLNRSEKTGDSVVSSAFNPPGIKVQAGHSFPLGTVTRAVDATVTYLEQEIPFNGSFRIYVFAGNPVTSSKPLSDLASYLQSGKSVLSNYQYAAPNTTYEHRHNPHSPFFTFSIIYNCPRPEIELHETVPEYFRAYRYQVYTDDRAHGKFAAGKGSVHAKLGLDAEKGGIVVVRPDGYIGCSIALVEGSQTAEALNEYFAALVQGPVKKEIEARL